MKKLFKCRALAIVLSICMLFGLLPVDMLGGVLEVKAEETTQTWDFTTAADSAAIQGTTGTYEGLEIDATSGKFDPRGTDLQINAGTKVGIPVSGNSTITIVAYNAASAGYVSIEGQQVSVSDATVTCNYTGAAGTVTMIMNGSGYLYKIIVEAVAGGSVSDNETGDATTYAVTVNLGDGPDLAGKSITYNFTNAEGETSSFTDAAAIKLADGTYTVFLGGDFSQCPYAITEGTSLTVSGAAVEHDIEFEEITKWEFTDSFSAIQKTTGYYKGIYVDASASTGKFSPNGNSAQFNTDTILKVPVKGNCTVTVTAYNSSADYAKYTIAGEEAANGVDTYEYVGDAGTVDIKATGNTYIFGVEVTYPKSSSQSYILNVADLADADPTTEEITVADYFTLTQGFTVQSNSKSFTVDGETVSVSKRMKTNGNGDASKRSIFFTVGSGNQANISVCTASSSTGKDAQLVLYKNGNLLVSAVVPDTAETTVWTDLEPGTYYLTSQKTVGDSTVGANVNFYYVKVTETTSVQSPTVSTVTATQDASDASGATVKVAYTGTAGGEGSKYVIEASNDDGANWTRVETADGTATSGTTTIDLSDAKWGFGTWKFRVKGSNEVVASESIVYAAKTYTLSGTYNTGLAEDAALLTNLTFTAKTDSIYEVPAVTIDANNYTYSVVLEKGTTYEVAAVGVDEYSLITPSAAFTYSADTTLNLEFKAKVFYPITISLGSTPDLTGKNVTYTFTHEDGAVYNFDSASGITLRDGKYTVSMGGDMAQMAYGIDKGATLTVAGAAVNHAITFKALTSWSFTELTETIQSTTEYFKGVILDTTNGKLRPNGTPVNSIQMNAGTTIKVPVTGPCTVSVTAYQGQYALYTINGQDADTSSDTTTVEYTGGAGTIDIVSTNNNAYIVSVTLTYPAEEVQYVAQSVMPFIPEDDTDANTAADTDGKPRVNKQDSITVQPVGQKLNLAQTGGKLADAYASSVNVAYYVFPKTSAENKLEFDLLVTESKATGNDAGFFGGVFTDNYVYTLGLRAGGTKIRGIYSKKAHTESSGFAGAGSPAEEVVGLNRELHYEITMSGGRPSVTVTFIDDEGVEQSRTWSQNPIAEPDGSTPTEFYYGFVLANVSATVTNMVYTDASGKVLYDQNACYYTKGAAPVASSVSAVAAESREYIDITWTGTVPEYDGTYVVEMQRDDNEWVELSQDVTGFSYRYEIPGGEGGNYRFRVCGQLGKETLGGNRNAYVTMADTIYVMGALGKPVVAIDASATDISISWDAIAGAEYYQIYRYSYDEGESGAKLVADKYTETSYTDTTVEQEMPYYYQVKAMSDSTNNSSALSDAVWQVATAGHTGEYVYENEATEIFVSKKSYDTVFTNKVTLEGNVYGEGTLVAEVNGTAAQTKAMAVGDAFSFELTVEEGRNDVNLLFTDEDGKVTRKTFNFVYLTNYDMVVDASYTGTDGEAVNGIPTYKTVQAAVNSVPSGNTDSKVILVMAGSYEERLEVNTPYITLIGEDRENTSIHCYPADILGDAYQAGGDMDKRCAIYIKSGATGFSAENLTFANDFVFASTDANGKQADAIRVDSDKTSFVNCKFYGVQDTLYMDKGNQYYYKCRIEGLVDFIYSGEKARAFFNDCDIVFVYEPTKMQGYVAAPKTAVDATYGLTFYNCTITAEEGCAGNAYLLARPWGANAYITWINCYMGKVLNKYAPYSAMSGNPHEDARFFEYGSYGPSFEINVDRRQISGNKAEEMISADYLGWNPESLVAAISADHYVGSVTTNRDQQFGEAVRDDSKYLKTDGDDTGLKMYDMEGYAEDYGVTGGGLLKETNSNYYKVTTAEEFLDALLAVKASGMNSVIELAADINLGCNEIENFESYKGVIKANGNQPLTHPTLMESGVSQLSLEKFYNLTIFSQNGSSIKHTTITLKNSENIMIRNIKFDELWEWDDATNGDYDRNDWDFLTIDSGCNGIWIDHCTFYKAYDGIVDIKNPNPINNVTISWCEFLPGSEGDEFFDVLMDEMAANPDKYPVYKKMLDGGMTKEQIYGYAHGQKKTHLLGQDDSNTNAVGIRLTMANNYYKNSMDRMPRLRYGVAHVYNCVMDSQELLELRLSISNPDYAKKVVSNGAISTCGGEVLLENCFISGIQNALNSGNGSSPSGYINAINSVYYMNGLATMLEPKANSSADDRVLVTDADEFIADLPYGDYYLYDADSLTQVVVPNAGAGKLALTVLQWEKAAYNDTYVEPEVPEDSEEFKAVITPGLSEEVLTDEIKKVTKAETVEELTAYLVKEVADSKIAQKFLPDMKPADTKVIDVVVKVSKDNGVTWLVATPDNFPATGLDVVIPYPDGTNSEDYDFVIGHMVTMACNGLTPGQMEFFGPENMEETKNGLKICIKSASPFVIGWEKVDTDNDGEEDPVGPGTEEDDEDEDDDKKNILDAILSPKTFFDEDSFIYSILWPDTDSEKAAQNEQNANADVSANTESNAAEDAQVAAGAVVQNAEKESNNLFVLIVVAAIAIIAASGVVLFRKKNEEM